MKAVLKNARISPKKMNLVAGLVRGKMVEDALNQLRFTPKKGAKILTKVIKSAAANAETNFKQEPKKLFIKEIVVNKAPTFKRSVPISRGRAHPILKRNSHVTVLVDVTASKAKQAEAATKAEAKAPKAQPSKKKPTNK
ncbi:50S ribosomal protein L22 [Patescibacteria group bacterium]|nr:50S ribosomal protein L22 [Patescibacteria group bacterium]